MASSFSSCKNTDIWAWIQTLPPLSKWNKNSLSICICSSNSSLSNLTISISKNPSPQSISFSILANFALPVSLWTSKPLHINSPSSSSLLDEDAVHKLILNIVLDVLKYGPNNNHSYPIKLVQIINSPYIKDIFNFSLLTLVFLVCLYEAPTDIRSNCLFRLTDELTTTRSKDASKMLMRFVGSNVEEQWLRSINLGITNWKVELKAGNRILRGPSPLFSHGFSTTGLWKVQIYCPVITMEVENSSGGSPDEHLMFSLNYHELEGVIQLNYKVTVNEKWVDVMVNIDNIRLDVIPLVSTNLLNERGAGVSEKHFPSRISLQLTPTSQTDILSVSVSKSSENPNLKKEFENSIEGSLELPHNLGLRLTAGETISSIMKPWKFEESAIGDSGSLSWYLHDFNNGREVFAKKPPPMAIFKPNAWFKHRYSNVQRPFTRQGGVVFASDEYRETVCWKVLRSAIGKRMEWEVSGSIGLTYWPNKYRTFYHETRRAEFRETLHLTLS